MVSRCSPFVVALSSEDRAILESRASSRNVSHSMVVRARIVLAAADGARNIDIAAQVGVCVDVVSRWRKRFCQEGVAGLKDRPRSGRPPSFGPEVVAGVKALACEPPEQREVPLSRWSSHELAAQVVSEGLVDSISSSTVRRWLHADAIKPWRYRSWIFPRDPNFADKAARVLDLYARVFDGVPLGPHDYVISADEKSQLQALHRCHPTRPAGPGAVAQVEFEYERGGTLAYMGAYDVHHARLVHLPVHASWLNQIEIVFSIIQRKVIKPADFADLAALADRLCRFEDRYNQTAQPFDWRFDRNDLTNMLARFGPEEAIAA